MIRTENEYQEAARRLSEDLDAIESQRTAFESAGLTADELNRAMEPLLSFHEQLEEEVNWYERVSRGELPAIRRLNEIGRLLIALRIASGLTQRKFADVLGVSEAVVSRDERNEYHGITVERAQRIFDLLQAEVTTHIEVSREKSQQIAEKSQPVAEQRPRSDLVTA